MTEAPAHGFAGLQCHDGPTCGHHVYVDGEENGKYTAYCTPYEEGCWFGPERGCATEALDDGRHHHAGHESELNPWWQQLEALRGSLIL